MSIKIALAGNPNCGKTTLFNALTGSNQFVGNWPGVTVEKKEGKLKKHNDVIITDLPGIYSLSPYTMEEVVARNYLLNDRPDVILNIIDGTNLERNLYLTTQLTEIGIPVVIAINMMDIVKKNGDKIDIKVLSEKIGCDIVEISALKQTGLSEVAEKAIETAKSKKTLSLHVFQDEIEAVVSQIEKEMLKDFAIEQRRWYAIKIFERDEKVLSKLNFQDETKERIEKLISDAEQNLDDDSEAIITSERYSYISEILKECYKKKSLEKLTTSDKIDKIVTNRFLGLPIFALIMFLVYYIAMVGVGKGTTDWTNDKLFDEGFHLSGGSEYSEASDEYNAAALIVDGYNIILEQTGAAPSGDFEYEVKDGDTLETSMETASMEDYQNAVATMEKYNNEEPDASAYGVFVPSIPALVEKGLDTVNCAEWLKGLILDGIVAGVGSVLGFVPQMLVLFLMLAFLEACGYMARIAFVLDRIFRRFGLSGKSFIPMLIGTGCGVPGIMASRTIENERDRRMTIMTTTFIPCGAKVPFISMIAGAIFGGSAWIATSAYFVGMLSVIVSGIILKKTKMFAGDPAPFVMELPSYHLPTLKNVLLSMWERGWSFIKKAGTIILLSTIFVWFTSYFGFTNDGFCMLAEEELDKSLLAMLGNTIAWIFTPLGWGNWQATVASITGLVAKENIVGTMGILYGSQDASVYQVLASNFTTVSGYSFLVFNLLCAPCFAAIGAIKREMNNAKWTTFAISYQCAFAYAVALIVNQFGNAFCGKNNVFGIIAALAVLAWAMYMLFKPYKKTV